MQWYNHTAAHIAAKLVNGGITLKAQLRNGTTFTATHSTLAEINGSEVSGNGWPAGGVALSGFSATTVETNKGQLDADNPTAAASGGDIGPADGVLYVDDSESPQVPLGFELRAEGPLTAPDGSNFTIRLDANGILTLGEVV